MNWAQKKRLEFIQSCLEKNGFLNREDICREFSISIPQASKDISEFKKTHPKAMTYDLSSKRYISRKKRIAK